ncbi:hypothetical protein BRETT_001193 [Brettanomyces bruxellensis]|uniref:UPF3 domain-containing protein n=1 Tax=Dekkera bruxellensis TaxID=5007 RepID=A0A871R6G5_DEKBR|nr:uncharacterized protein BRETT_001193 [Brettanomyces bruxellensis]QOU21469.1 hypothetical protein BRETT_001193 [Brettanomyces bruxellensis]
MRHSRSKFKKNSGNFAFNEEEYLDNATAKIIVANLPPRLDGQGFLDQANLTDIGNFYYVKGHDGKSIYEKPVYSRAYISFETEEQAKSVANRLSKSSFMDSVVNEDQGTESESIQSVNDLQKDEIVMDNTKNLKDQIKNQPTLIPKVSRATYLEMPKHIFSEKTDPSWDTIQETISYKLFLNYLEDPSSGNADKVLDSCYPKRQKTTQKNPRKQAKGKKTKNINVRSSGPKSERSQKEMTKKERQKIKRLKRKAFKEAKLNSDKKAGYGNKKNIPVKTTASTTKGKEKDQKKNGKKQETPSKRSNSSRTRSDKKTDDKSKDATKKPDSRTTKLTKKSRRRKKVKKSQAQKSTHEKQNAF